MRNHGFFIGHSTLNHDWFFHEGTRDGAEQVLGYLEFLDQRLCLLTAQLSYLIQKLLPLSYIAWKL